MKIENNKATPLEDIDGDNLDLKKIIEKYLIHWKWFLLASILSICLAFYYLSFQRSTYEATASIKIKNEQNGDRSALSAFQDLGIIAQSNQNVEDEMEVLLSKDLIAEVIKSLNLNVQVFSDKTKLSKFMDDYLSTSTEFYENERYTNPPLEINFLISDSVLYNVGNQFIISVNSSNNFTYTDVVTSNTKKHVFGEKITTPFGEIVVTPNADYKKNDFIGSEYLIRISSLKKLVAAYSEKLTIEPISEYSNILSLKITDPVVKKAEDFLSELVKKYNDRAILMKEELTKSTSDFVNKRLEIISNELNEVDLTAETIKTKYKMSDVGSETGLNMQSSQELESQIVQANAQLETIGYMKDFVENKNEDELIPSNVGVQDNNVSTSIQQYNQLMMQKKKFLETSTEKNPIVANLNEQLKDLKTNIDQGLNNLESTQKISLEALNRQDMRINSRLYSAPKQERQYRDIQRQQQIKESLFLYLLEKREETALTLGIADPNAKIIDSPSSSIDPVAPKKAVTFIGFLILGLLIPFIIFYLRELLDTRIHTRDEIENVLNIPVIGDIPRIESKQPYLIKKDDYSGVAESFRILRTNLNFIAPTLGQTSSKCIFITSTIAGEGKSMIASNLAVSLAHAGKKTLLLGMDIRAPKINSYLDVKSKVGITNFIIDHNLKFKDLIVNTKNINDLDIITSGDLAPNPSELLMNDRIKELFSYAKESYEYIVVDTAAFSMVTDTMLLSGNADAFIYVVRANFLDKRFLKYIKNLHSNKRLPNLSILVNSVDYKKSYGYGYGYGYGSEFEKHKKKPWWKFS